MRYYNISELSQHTFYQVDKNLIAALDDFLLAGVLSSLINATTNPAIIQYRGEHDGFFFITVEKMYEELRINYKQQKRCLEDLAALGLISLSNFGVPCKRHVRVENTAIVQFLNSYLETKQKNDKTLPKTNDREQFYDNINESIAEGEESFVKRVDNMDPRFAAPLYVFTRALQEYHGITITWDSAAYGKFKSSIGYKQVDYRRLLDILKDESFKKSDNVLWNFRVLNKKTFDNPPALRIAKASLLPEWSWLSQSFKNLTTN